MAIPTAAAKGTIVARRKRGFSKLTNDSTDERQAAERHAVREAERGVGVAQRIAQRDHRHQAESTEQLHRRQQQDVSGPAGDPAHEMDQPERRHEDERDIADAAAIVVNRANGEVLLDRGDVGGGEHGDRGGARRSRQSRVQRGETAILPHVGRGRR